MSRGKAKASLELIDACIKILSTIQPATVRAVCYQLFIRKLIADMSKNSTNRVSRQLRDARENGDVPWSWIVDETREVERIAQWSDLARFADVVRNSYRRNRWQDQPRRIEVWSEKGTVRGTLQPVLKQYGVSFRVMHGYGSATAINDVAQMTEKWERPLLVLYVGDHDPSGRHMSDQDLPDRLDRYWGKVEMRRVALVPELHCAALPWFSAEEKRTDPRYKWFVSQFGDRRCWELDAMNPNDLRAEVEQHIRDVIDFEKWDHHEHIEQQEFQSLEDYTQGLRQAGCAT